eukprot:972530-Prorocentrum_minimum.AAC.1
MSGGAEAAAGGAFSRSEEIPTTPATPISSHTATHGEALSWITSSRRARVKGVWEAFTSSVSSSSSRTISM